MSAGFKKGLLPMRRYWVSVVVVVLVAGFGLKAYQATLPPSIIGDAYRLERTGEENAQAVTAELRKRFPAGMPEKDLIEQLDAAGFDQIGGSGSSCGPLTEKIKQRKDRNYVLCPFVRRERLRKYGWGSILCSTKRLGVGWAVDSRNRLTQIDGYVWYGCNSWL